MVSLKLGHKSVIKKHRKPANTIEGNSLNTFNWTIEKLGHKLMVSHKLRSYVTLFKRVLYSFDLSNYYSFQKSTLSISQTTKIVPFSIYQKATLFKRILFSIYQMTTIFKGVLFVNPGIPTTVKPPLTRIPLTVKPPLNRNY